MEREAYIYSLFPELERVTDRTLAQKAVELWLWFWDHSSYRDLESAPFKSGSASLRLIGHVQSVVKSAVGMADTVMRVQHVRLDMDLLIVTAVLHDVSKLIEYEEDADGRAQFTYRGAHFPHAFWGAQKAAEFGLPDAVVAGILTHPASCPTQQNTNESILLQHADIASACMQ